MKGKNLFAPVDFTLGRTRKLILFFTLSIALTTLLKNAFSLINSLVLKYTVGGIAVTAINATGTISSLIFNFAYGCSSGFAVLIGNAFGKEAQAAQGVYTQMENYLSIPLSSTATTLLNFTAQNYGKRDEKRIKEGIREATRINVGFYLVILIVCQIIAPHIAYFFLPAQDVGADVVYYSSTYLRVIAFFLIFQGLLQLARSVLQGIQKPLIPFFSGIGELIARIIVAFLLPALVDPSDIHSRKAYFAVCFSTPCAWVISFLIMGISVFVLIYRKGISSPAEKSENEIEPR